VLPTRDPQKVAISTSRIAGKAPPLNLPAEYEDDRPLQLKKFRARMIADQLWQK